MAYQYQASEEFWARFYALENPQKESLRKAWEIFKSDPFDVRLRSHKIAKLSARYHKTIYSAVIEGDLRVLFCIEGDVIKTITVGTHAVYR